MVVDVEPVADVQPVTVKRHSETIDEVGDEQRDHLFGKLVSSVVVGTARRDRVETVGLMIRPNDEITSGFARCVGGIGKERFIFVPRAAVDGPVDLVGRDVKKPCHVVGSGGIEQNTGSEDVCFDENPRVAHRAVYVRFGGEMDDVVGSGESRTDELAVSDVALNERQTRIVEIFRQIGQSPGICQCVEHDNRGIDQSVVAVFEEMTNKVRADKARSASDNNAHKNPFRSPSVVRQYAGRVNPASSKHLILLDATAISAQRGGVGRYVEELARQAAIAGAPVIVVCQLRDEQVFASFDCDIVIAPRWVRSVPLRFLWEQVGLPALARRLQATVIHSPHYTFPLITGRRRVVTVHDLTFWTFPDRHSPLKRKFFRWWISASARKRLDVIVPSRATGDEYERLAHADSSRVSVAYHGVDRDTFHPPTTSAVTRFANTLGIGTWVAFVGTIEPRKNVVPLIDGFQLAVAPLSPRPALLLAGAPGWDNTVAEAIDRAVRAGFDVRHLGYVPLDDLSTLLGGATVVAYPSEGEGFGLPVLEAMSCGAPVLTSRSLSLPEVGGDAVAYTDTTAGAIGVALTELLGDSTRRGELKRAAINRAAGFTWSACLSVHRNVWER